MPRHESIDDNESRAFIGNSSTSRRYSHLGCSSKSFGLLRPGPGTIIFFLCACIAYFFGIGHRQIAVRPDDYQAIYHSDDELIRIKTKLSPLFIFGHSTGHSGTGTFHESLIQTGCPWNYTVDEFEYLIDGEKKWPYDSSCSLVKTQLVPHLQSIITNASISDGGTVAYVDMGHFHNRGRTLECLAEHLGSTSVFVHLRRNRYNIARSFTDSMTRLAAANPDAKITPCMSRNIIKGQIFAHPHVSICPRSTENNGPVNLMIDNDKAWDSLSTFQQFLWYADEMELRWHNLQMMFDDNNLDGSSKLGTSGTPTFIEVTWNNEMELEESVNLVRKQLGCTPLEGLVNQHPHVKHKGETLNCSQFLWEDLEYRKAMNFSPAINEILFTVPQIVGGGECIESNAEMEQRITEYSLFHGIEFEKRLWTTGWNNGQH